MTTDGFSKLFTKTNKPVEDLEEIILAIGLIFKLKSLEAAQP